jgi:hypothetical protein
MVTKTQWWDKNGDVHDGYIKDGKTYLDEAGTARVPVGATVQTNGGTYKMTSSGGVPTMATARNQYVNNSNAAINAYQAAGQVQEERIRAATDAAIAEVNRQKSIAEQQQMDADKAAMNAYRAAANPFGAMEEQRVRLGLDESGYAESSKLRLASDLAAQQVANLRAKNEQIQALDVQIAQAKASGQYELANMLEARAQNVMQQKLALESNLYSGDMQAIAHAESVRQFEENMAYQAARDAVLDEWRKTEWNYGVEQDKLDNEWRKTEWNYGVEQDKKAAAQAEADRKVELALTFLQAGRSSPWIAEALKVPIEDVNALAASVNAQKVAASRSTGGSSYRSSGSSKSGGSSGKSQSAAYKDVVATAKGYKDSPSKAREYLDNQVIDNKITLEEAIYIYETILGFDGSSLQPTEQSLVQTVSDVANAVAFAVAGMPYPGGLLPQRSRGEDE